MNCAYGRYGARHAYGQAEGGGFDFGPLFATIGDITGSIAGAVGQGAAARQGAQAALWAQQEAERERQHELEVARLRSGEQAGQPIVLRQPGRATTGAWLGVGLAVAGTAGLVWFLTRK